MPGADHLYKDDPLSANAVHLATTAGRMKATDVGGSAMVQQNRVVKQQVCTATLALPPARAPALGHESTLAVALSHAHPFLHDVAIRPSLHLAHTCGIRGFHR